MEALVVALGALVAAALIDAGYWIAVSLMRWAPFLAAGLVAAWLGATIAWTALSPRRCRLAWTEAPRNSGGWWARLDSNQEPDRYERPALTIELRAPIVASAHVC